MSNDKAPFTLYLVGHAHIDLGYRWRWNETVHRIARDTFSGVLRLMEQVPDWVFVQSQLALYQAMKEHYPDLFTVIKARIAEGRWIVADGWCEYDQTMPDGESIIRQHLIGSRYARQELDTRITLAWAPDAFSGHVHTLPTILKGCGIDFFLYGRGMPDRTPYFWWEGPDGSRVLAYSPAYGYSAAIGPQVRDVIDMWRELTGDNEMLFLYGRGDHGGGPREGDFEALQELCAGGGELECLHAPPHVFFDRVLAQRPDLPVYRGELLGESTGSLSSVARIKAQNRRLENLLLSAERFATLSMFLQRKPSYPRVDFEAAWRLLLHHQFHDELPGTSRAPVHRDVLADLAQVETDVAALRDDALAEIGARLDTRGEGVPLVVYNGLSWAQSEPVRATLRLSEPPRRLVVRDAARRPLPTQTLALRHEGHYWYADLVFLAPDVPGLGYRLFRAWSEEPPPTPPASALSVSEARDVMVMQNEYLLLTVDRHNGHVLSLFDKRLTHEVLAGPGNVLQVIAERPGYSTAWIIALSDEMVDLDQPESVEIVRDGPLQGVIRISYRYRDSYFVQEITLTAGVPRLDMRLEVDWYERDCCLKVAFPTAVYDGTATFEAPFGAISRPADGTEVPAQRWIDLSAADYGLSLLNEGRYAFDVHERTLRMTVVRGIPDLDPEADVGRHELRYALYPHAGGWQDAGTVRQGWALNMPLLARQALCRAGMIAPWIAPGINHAMPAAFGFLQIEPANIVLSALKLEEEYWGPASPVIMRLYETAGRETEAHLRFSAPVMMIEATNHLEEPIGGDEPAWEEDRVTVHLRPHEIKTFRLRLAVPGFAIYEGETHRSDLAPGQPPGFGEG